MLTLESFLGRYNQSETPTGDMVLSLEERYTQPQPARLIVNISFLDLLKDPHLLELLTNHRIPLLRIRHLGAYSVVTRETLMSSFQVAVKRLRPADQLPIRLLFLSGFDYYQVNKDLNLAGFPCATPLVATHNRFISLWINGKQPPDEIPNIPASRVKRYQHFQEYVRQLWYQVNDFKQSGKWDSSWVLDDKPQNYRVVEGVEDGQPRYTSIDPVSRIRKLHQIMEYLEQMGQPPGS